MKLGERLSSGNLSKIFSYSAGATLAAFLMTTVMVGDGSSALAQDKSPPRPGAIAVANNSGSATDAVRTSVDEVLHILNDTRLKSPEKKEERRRLMEEAISKLANFNDISARVLGKHWKNLNNNQKDEFVVLFKDFLSRVYAGKMDEYASGQVQYLSERLEGNYAEVKTKVASGNTTIPMDYRLQNRDGHWQVYDIVVDGISLVQNYRAQFDKIIQKSSFNGLLDELRKKQTQLNSGMPTEHQTKSAVIAPHPD